MDDLVSEFLAETAENLEELDNDLIALEQTPENKDIIGRIFRVMHTIKGTCGFIGLIRLASVAHSAENVLDKIRGGELAASSEAISLILKATDSIKGLVAHLEESGAEPEGDDSALISALDQFAESGGAAAPAPEEAPKEEAAPPANKTPDLDEEIDFDPVPAPWLEEEKPAAAESEKMPEKQAEVAQKVKDAAVAKGLEVAKKEEAPKEEDKKPASVPAAGGGAAQSIRVNLNVLEGLMQMASELVLTRNQLLQIARNNVNSPFTTPLQRLNHITTELQENVMKTRMQPIGNAWSKFPRIIRDLSMELGKKIELKMEGEETELDRQLLDVVKDPLTHMVRNSADHGIEMPDARTAAGKPETGTITLTAYHEGGHILVKIVDDGKGINVDAIKKKAIEKGLATEAEVEHMTDKQVFQFIFQPGFSTAEKVTSVSGRGVGMDVVVNNIQKIGGTVELDSEFGKGSEFMIKIPLTLAIMSVLIVGCGGQRFAIPQIRISEIVRVNKYRKQTPPLVKEEEKASEEKAKKAKENSPKKAAQEEQRDVSAKSLDYVIETLKDSQVLRLRGSLLPLVSLRKVLGIEGEEAEKKHSYVVVCELGTQRFGVVVEHVYDTEEIVVKPASRPLQNIGVYSGITILGDGSVIMILDPNGIAATMGDSGVLQRKPPKKPGDEQAERKVSFLMFRAGGRAKKVVPVELVARLEEIDMGTVEWAGDRPVVQYRDDLMRLVTAEEGMELPKEGVHDVIVFIDENKIVGLVVEKVLDIAEHVMDVKTGASKGGILGSLVIDKEACDLVDVSYYFSRTYPEWLVEKQQAQGRVLATGKRLLLVDDSPFFRKFMKPVLSVAGYEVSTAEDAIQALEVLKKDVQFDAVVTDIDMPGVTGVEFVKQCKADPKLSHIPFIALTSYTKEKLGDTQEMGFSGYVSKSNRDKLVNTLGEVLG